MSTEKGYTRIGLFTYKQIKEDEYEVGLDIPIKFTKKQQKELEGYIQDVFGEENSMVEIVGEQMTATKFFTIRTIK